jgi:hypothetical protein
MQQKNSERIQVVVRARPISDKEVTKGYQK